MSTETKGAALTLLMTIGASPFAISANRERKKAAAMKITGEAKRIFRISTNATAFEIEVVHSLKDI